VGLDDGDFDPVGIGDHGRIRADCAFHGAEEGVAVAADDDVDQRQGGSDLEIDRVADMAQKDNLVDAGCVERFGSAADILDDVVELDVFSGGDFRGVFCGGTDDADLFAADFNDDGALDLAGEIGVAGDVEIAADDGE